MKKSTINFAVFTILGVILPLSGDPGLILSAESITLVAFIAVLIFSQPSYSLEDGHQNRQTDQGSMTVILICSLLTITTSVMDWAYRKNGTTVSSFECIGLSFMVVGVAFRIWAIKTLGRYFSTSVKLQKDHKLILSGPYRYLRHPSYSGAYLTFIGMTIFLSSWIGMMTAIFLMGYAYKKRIDAEEALMIHGFGDAYEQYSRSTYKLIPVIW